MQPKQLRCANGPQFRIMPARANVHLLPCKQAVHWAPGDSKEWLAARPALLKCRQLSADSLLRLCARVAGSIEHCGAGAEPARHKRSLSPVWMRVAARRLLFAPSLMRALSGHETRTAVVAGEALEYFNTGGSGQRQNSQKHAMAVASNANIPLADGSLLGCF